MYVYKDIKYINMYICVSALHEVNISFFTKIRSTHFESGMILWFYMGVIQSSGMAI